MTTTQDYLDRANKFKNQGKLAEAIEGYLEALKLDPDFVPALRQLADVYEIQEEFHRSIDCLQKAVNLRPKAAQIQARLARLMMKQGNLKEAIFTYQKAITLKLKPSDLVYRELGDAFKKDGQIDRAVDAYKKAIKLNEDSFYCYQQLLKLGCLDEFYQCSQEALRKNPSHVTLEKIYLPSKKSRKIPKKQLRKSLEILKSWIEKDPENVKLLVNISALAKNANEIKDAEIYASKALSLEPDNMQALYLMGMILELKQDWNRASDYYKRSTQPNAKANLLICIYNSNKFSKDIFTKELTSSIERSSAITFIKDGILSKLNIDYENHLIFYQRNTNVGDTCKQLSLIKPLCLQHRKKAIVFYPNSHSPTIQARLFLDPIMPEYVACHFPIDTETQQKIHKLTIRDEISLDRLPIIPGVPKMTLVTVERRMLAYIKDESIYKDGMAATLGLNIDLSDETIGKPSFNNLCRKNASDKFDDLNLCRGQAILIAPHSSHMNALTGSNSKLISFWRKIINRLSKYNIAPVINAKHGNERLGYLSTLIGNNQQDCIKFVDLPLDEVIPFIELCGAFAGIRSGLCDLASFSSKNVTKLCVQPRRLGDNCFGKLPGRMVPEDTLINENFHLYFASVENPPEDEQIEKIIDLFLNRDSAKY